MYGLIHNALRDMVLENYGEKKWNEILQDSESSDQHFVTMQSYEDEISYNLVGSASKVLGAPAEDCLENFGYYWLSTAAPKFYNSLLGSVGGNIYDFLNNVNNLHDRITTTFIDYRPPTFRAEVLDDNKVKWHYQSPRLGLTPFVKGIVSALAERFEVQIEIELIEPMEVDVGEYSIFHLVISD